MVFSFDKCPGNCPMRRYPSGVGGKVSKKQFCVYYTFFQLKEIIFSGYIGKSQIEKSANVLKAHGKFEVLIDLIDLLHVSVWHSADCFYLNHW